MFFPNPEARNSPNTPVYVQICLWCISSWCRGKLPPTAHPGKGRGWRGQLKPEILICSHKSGFILLMIASCSMAPTACSYAPSPGNTGQVKQKNSHLTRVGQQLSGKTPSHQILELDMWCWNTRSGGDSSLGTHECSLSSLVGTAMEFSHIIPASELLSLSEYTNSVPAPSWESYPLHQRTADYSLCAKHSGFLSLRAQSSHHLWQKDGWKQD